MYKQFTLKHNFAYDLTRPVNDMAAFFYYEVGEGEAVLRLTKDGLRCSAQLELGGQRYRAELLADSEVSGELTRCVKLLVVQCFEQAMKQNSESASELDSASKSNSDLESKAKPNSDSKTQSALKAEPEMPWGILTGVRPGKLAHKLLDSGIAAENLPDYLQNKYLLPREQGQLLTNICLLQKKLLPDSERKRELGLYIGIPFCPSRCSYCSFPAGIIPANEDLQQNFLNFIEQDLKNVVQLLGMHSLKLVSLYIGGGTPTSLAEKPFARLLEMVQKHLPLSQLREYTVEAGRPDCFSKGKLAVMEAAGVNRISVNPQSFHDRTLEAIGRRHTVADFYKAYELVRASRIPIINMDLIIGLPGEGAEDVRYSLARAVELAPENLTVHTLTLKRNAPLFGTGLTSVGLSAEEAAELVEQGREAAAQLGMHPYYLYRQHYMLGHLANIGYAQPGTESIYNIQMMEERHPVIGVGPSSASKAPLADGHHLHKLNMPKNIKAYETGLEQLFAKRAALFAND